jgi:hypothetical protein
VKKKKNDLVTQHVFIFKNEHSGLFWYDFLVSSKIKQNKANKIISHLSIIPFKGQKKHVSKRFSVFFSTLSKKIALLFTHKK